MKAIPCELVIITGCGVAGPVLGIFLELKRYEPVIYERLSEPTHLGLGLGKIRTCLFGEEKVNFTGLTQTGGISPRPDLPEHGLLPDQQHAYLLGVHIYQLCAVARESNTLQRYSKRT
ncbi:hypothetical protein OBBRIDRAFT_411620 [Obba rivulosa]|uniref:Uncharacterized protein n=1 Tax=Obba rivulosa TaxID=1052685 RepID=A0A8E2B344_9APHY|nr:hypothetical protein OBBRIDRAFT_411620 [Obba rivulosa]